MNHSILFKRIKSKSSILLLVLTMTTCYLSFGQNLATEVDNIAISNDMMGGAVVFFCESEIIDSHYFGKSDYQRNYDIDQNTKFRIASISKSVTAIAIMQLVEQNVLDLDDDISIILGFEVKNPNYPSSSITPRMLLSHTSTIIDGSTYSSFLSATVNNDPIPNLSELLDPSGTYYTTGQFNNALPGTYFNYSNVNFVILGTIVEKISNLRFDVYCKQNIFMPLGIDASFNVNDIQNIDDVAVLYRKTSGTWTAQTDNFQGVQPIYTNLNGYIPGTNGGRFAPQGGLRCSAEDLAKIMMCLNNPQNCIAPLLNSNSTDDMKAMQWTYNGSNGNNYYGLFLSWGLGIHRITSTPGSDIVLPGSNFMFGHAGEAYGLVSDAYFDPDRKVGLVFITNGVGIGYQTNSNSAFYTVEQEIFNAIEDYGDFQSCLTLNTEETEVESKNFEIFPNPGNKSIQLNIKAKNGDLLFKVYSIDGRFILEKKLDNLKNTIDVSDLSNGIYLFHIDNQIIKFIKY